ncbi:uncharacterized protein LOC135348684 [Halichondria panicea]|uniref:uncharacterized protein LOC135348684 n=1 Tax=Halichondria panicea TaxID=6063 RepID=UPI00312B8756
MAVRGGAPPKWFVLCGPLLLSSGFCLYPVVIKYFLSQAKEKANPYVFTFYRDAGAVPVLFLASYIFEGPIQIPDRKMGAILVLLGFIGTFVSHFLYISGAFNLDPDIATAIMSILPVSTSIVSVLMCTESPPSIYKLHSWAKFIGITVAVVGAVFLSLFGSSPQDNGGDTDQYHRKQQFGSICLFADTVTMALFYSLQKKCIFRKRNCKWKNYPLAVTGYGYLFGSVFMCIFVQYYTLTGQTHLFRIPTESYPALLYGIFITSALCYFLLTWSNKYLPSTIVAAFRPIQVIGTFVAAYLVFGDTLTPTQCLAAFIAVCGVGLVLYSNWMEENRSSESTALGLRTCCRKLTLLFSTSSMLSLPK